MDSIKNSHEPNHCFKGALGGSKCSVLLTWISTYLEEPFKEKNHKFYKIEETETVIYNVKLMQLKFHG